MAERKVEFLPEGHRVTIAPQEVVRLWCLHTGVDPRYALGTAQHETDLTVNEKDTEVTGFISMGLYQISKEEMIHVGMADADPYDAEENTIVFAKLTEERHHYIMGAVRSYNADDMRAYLFIAHNQGLAACLKTIKAHGMDWASYKDRNITEATQKVTDAKSSGDRQAVAEAEAKLEWWRGVVSYGNDCVSGGKLWNPKFLTAAGFSSVGG
jgi:hypothetical protein